MKMSILIVFIGSVIIGQLHENLHLKYYRWLTSGFGVFAILFVCDYIASLLFGKDSEVRQWKVNATRMVSYISYASMSCYMFHRLFFWMGEQVWNPSVTWINWLYMGALVFPVMIVLSYYIQRYYDLLIKKV